MKRIFSFCVIINIIFICLCGCTISSRELKDLEIIKAIAVDKTDDGYEVSLQVLDTYKASGVASDAKGNLTKVISSSGKSITQAMTKATVELGGEPFEAHNEVIILSEDICKNGVEKTLDFFFRDYQTRLNVPIVMVKGKASDVLEVDFEDALIPAEDLIDTINLCEKYFISPKTEILQILQTAYTQVEDYYITALKVTDEGDKKSCDVEGVGVFRAGEFKGYLTENETKGLMLLNSDVQTGEIVIDSHEIGVVTLDILKSKTTFKVSVNDDVATFNFLIDTDYNISEINTENAYDMPLNITKDFEYLVNEQIESQIEQTISKCIFDYNVDVLQLSSMLKRSDMDLYKSVEKNWREFIKNSKFSLKLSSNITRIGEENFK